MVPVTKAFLEKAYLAYFGRPADPNGALFWMQPGTTEADVINGFSNSAESIALYGAPTVDLGAVITQVSAIYQVLFNRPGDTTGVTWWANQIITGQVAPAGAAIAILNGAQGTDAIKVENKLAAAAMFTAGLDTIEEINGFSGAPAIDSSRAFLASITTTPATQAQVDAAIVAAINAGNPVPVELTVDSPSVLEGDAGTTNLVFTLTLSEAQTTETTVNFQTLNSGTATPGSDFLATAGVVVFAPGQTVATVSVTVKGDTNYEPDETVQVLFSGTTLASSVTATGTIVNDDLDPSIQPQTFVLTAGQDIFTGRAGDDTFLATGQTLNLGDRLDGGAGNDTLDVSISGSPLNTGFAATSIETIRVKAQASGVSTLNMNDVVGTTRIESNESTSNLSFEDIQSVNGVDISITDTSANHRFNYDTNAFTSGVDAVDLRLAEVTGSQIQFTTGSAALGVEQINIDSQDNPNPDAGDSDATVNTVSRLSVGDHLTTVNITGNADLAVNAPLDINVARVDAGTLDGDLTLDLSNSNDGNPATNTDDGSTVEEIVYIGAMQDDHVEFRSTDNRKNVTLGNGDDWVRTGVGIAMVDGGAGNDTIMTGALNDNVVGGTGNDVVTDAGADNATTGWTAVYSSGGNTFALGLGDDSLSVTGSGNNTADLGGGNDMMFVGGTGEDTGGGEDMVQAFVSQMPYVVEGNQSVTAGDGNDTVQLNANGWANVDLGAGNDSLVINRSTQSSVGSTVAAGEGNDTVTIYSNGNVNGTGGDGNDSFTIFGNGGHTLDMGADNDSVSIYGNGVHNIDLGSGNDNLYVGGSRNTAGNADNGATDGVTVINAGEGDDLVEITENHYLAADLGAGNDQITLRAKDLTSDDTVAGGTGNDTMWLRNAADNVQDGRILASETIHTTGFETYELLNSNISLKLTDRMISTAENMDFTVSTVNSNSTDLPGVWSTAANGWIYPLVQGMTNAQFDVYVAATRDGDFDYTPDAPTLRSKEYYDDLAGPESARLAQAEQDLRDYISQFVTIDDTDTNHDGDTTDLTDQLFFIFEQSGAQTVDMTGITVPEYKFTLEGGNVRDIVIGDDASINGQMTLNYNYGGTMNDGRTALSATDTLQVVGGAEITAADLRNVTGLERIELMAGSSGEPQIWGIELTDRVIDQTTGSATLVIRTDPNTAGQSELWITLDPSIVNASNDVRIEKSANVTVFINGQEVTEPQFGDDFNPGTYSITVVNQLIFTDDGDHLVGTNGNDTFIANELNHIQAGDSADGNGGEDTLELNFTINNPSTTLQDAFGDAQLTEIERIQFNTGLNVAFGGIGFNYATDLQELATGAGNDTLTLMRQGLQYELNAGNDSIALLNAAGRASTTVHGGAGTDTVIGSDNFGQLSGNDYIYIKDVESVDGQGGEDTVQIMNWTVDTNPAVDHRVQLWDVESIYGSDEGDHIIADMNGGSIYVDGADGQDTITVGQNTPSSATVYGGYQGDLITVNATSTAEVHGDLGANPSVAMLNGNDTINVNAPSVTVTGDGGNDSISVYATVAASVDGGTGNDYVYIQDSSFLTVVSTYNATVNGGDGNDTVSVQNPNNVTVTGGDGNDAITAADVYGNASLSGNDGDDSIVTNYANNATVYGGSGNDTVQVTDIRVAASVVGGSGNDAITVSANNSGTVISVIGGEGNDVITVGYGSQGGLGNTTISGGSNNDSINLWLDSVTGAGGVDRIDFGQIEYNALQTQIINTQGVDTITNFVFENSGAPPAPAPLNQDLINLGDFLPSQPSVLNRVTVSGTWDHGTSVTANLANSNSLVMLSSNGATLTSADFGASIGGGVINLRDNARAVVVVGQDETSPGAGIKNFDIYYVQDVDTTTTGQAWKVDLVAHVESATLVGISSISDNFVYTAPITAV